MANDKKSMLKKGFYLMKKKYLAILVAVVGVMGAAIGGTMSYMTETEEVTNVFTVGDLDMGQNETDWELTGTNGKDVYPGYTAYKNPTIKNISDTTNGEEPAYARMTIYVQDPNGNLITDQTALDLIEQTIRFDGSYTGNYANAGKATGLVEGRIPGYSLADISKYPMVNPKWSKDTVRSTANKWVFNYNGDNNGILKGGEESTLFTTVAIPTDWNQTQLKSIGTGVAGTYKLHIVTEAIQASGFATQADAYNALDKEIAAGTLQHIDRN